jgi:hypothetical protein
MEIISILCNVKIVLDVCGPVWLLLFRRQMCLRNTNILFVGSEFLLLLSNMLSVN